MLNTTRMNRHLTIFLLSSLQVGLVALNTVFISKNYVLAVVLTTFSLNLIWTFNVSKVGTSKISHKITYALGGSFGALIALLISNH